MRPLIVLIHLLINPALDGYLTLEEFCYLVPLCINADTVEQIRQNIIESRAGRKSIDRGILDIILAMDTMQQAKKLFLKSKKVTPGLIMTVGMNRKSRTKK